MVEIDSTYADDGTDRAESISEQSLALVADGLNKLRERAYIIKLPAFQQAIDAIDVAVVPSGFCSAEVTIDEDKASLRIDSGLLSAIALGSVLVARHFDQGLFRVSSVDEATRASFARLFQAFLGQYYLFGYFRLNFIQFPDDILGKTARLMASEAAIFIVAHEIGHVVAGHLAEKGSTKWLDRSKVSARVHDSVQEIEADALAVAVALADLFGATVPEGLADLRLLSVRLAYEVLSSVEHCYLVNQDSTHLPAEDRWNGVLNSLYRRFPETTLARISDGWKSICEPLRFPVSNTLRPAAVTIENDLGVHGWPVPGRSATGRNVDWNLAEEISHQFRLDTVYQYVLIGAEALGALDLSAIDETELLAAGRAVVDELDSGLPRLLRGRSPVIQAAPGVSDLVRHLRRRAIWPEPFRSNETRGLPIHLAAGALARRLSARAGTTDAGLSRRDLE